MPNPLFKRLSGIPQHPQTQLSLTSQLEVLRAAANRLGLYDGADFIDRVLRDSQGVERRGPGEQARRTRGHEEVRV